MDAIELETAPWQSYAAGVPMIAMVVTGTIALHLWRRVLGDRAPYSASVDWLGWLPALLVAIAVPVALTMWYLQARDDPVDEALRMLLIPTTGLAVEVAIAAVILAVSGVVRHARRVRARQPRSL